MKKLTKKLIEEMKADTTNVIFENSGFIKIVKENGDVVLDWINENTLEFAIDNYEELDKVCNSFYKNLVSKKYKGSALDKIAQAESSYTDHDKAVINNVNHTKLMGF